MKSATFYFRGILLTFCFVLGSLQIVFPNNLDKLKLKLKTSKEDTNKVLLLIDICSEYGSINLEESIQYSKEALTLSTKLNYLRGIAKASIHLGENYTEKGEFDLALHVLNDAAKLCAERKEKKLLLAKINISIAGVYYYKGDYNKALDYYLKDIELLNEPRQKQELAKVLHNIATLYYQTNKLKDSKEYALKSQAMFEELRDTASYSASISLLATIYYNEESYAKALVHYKKAMALAEHLNDKSFLNENLNGIGIVYADTKKYSEAIPYFNQSLEIAKEIGDQQSIATCLLNLGICYSGLNNQSEAINFFHESLDISTKIGSKYSIKENYYFMTKAYEKQGNYKNALESLHQFTIVNDSIFNESNNQQINELSVKYENEKKEKEIALLSNKLILKEKDQNLLNAKIQQRNGIIIGTIITSLFIVFIIILLFNRRRLVKENEFQVFLNKQREQNIIDVFKAQENEQSRIAKDLHDGVGIYLSTLKLNIQLYKGFIPVEKTDEYQASLHLIDTISVELRNVMNNLSNETLMEYGLIKAFEELVNRVNALDSVHIEFIHHGMNKRLNEVIETNLYRVGQELITNTVKYAKASLSTLQLIRDDNSITLMLEDNGIGFDATKYTTGMGIKNIHKRVVFMNGTVRFESNSKNGTTCVIEIPIS